MFKRLILEDWHYGLPLVSFGITAVVFVIVVIRALRMKREKADHMAKLPLEKDQPPSKRNH